jgi:periplasmic divalent cation tolerance protein
MPQLIVITTTSDAQDVLEEIADALVADRLAACCQVSQPIKSIYRWDGCIQSSTEFQLKVKSAAVKFDEVAAVIKGLHNYDVPQIVAVDVTHVDAAYRDWIESNLS